MFPDKLIADDSLRTDAAGWSVEVRIPWYRALPLSSVTNVQLAIDGTPVDHEAIAFAVNDHHYALDDLGPRHDEWWYVTDGARLVVDRPGGLDEGEHEIDLTLGIYIPYLVFGGETLVVSERCTKTMAARAEVQA